MNLNKASLDVWQQLLREDNYVTISNRLIELDEKEELTKEELEEFKLYSKLEKKFLLTAVDRVENNKKVIRRLEYYKILLKDDERLLFIFLDRVRSKVESQVESHVEDLDKVYIDMMEEDMDIQGNEKLTKKFEEMVEFATANENIPESCNNPDCLYCRSVTDEENDYAYAHLLSGGYLDNINEQSLMSLMVLVNRLEKELNQYTDLDCDLEFDDDILDDDDED